MSELINNRKNAIKNILKQLNEGATVEQVQEEFERELGNVSAREISDAEHELVKEGTTIEEIQKLCDVHAAVFKGSIEDIHKETDQTILPGHPVFVLKKENRFIETQIERNIRQYIKRKDSSNIAEGVKKLLQMIDIHYAKKENLLFPYMEKYGIEAPPKVMWGVDDEIRDMLKASIQAFSNDNIKDDKYKELDIALEKVVDMIFKEESIMLPMLIDVMNNQDWKTAADGASEFGNLYENVPEWNPPISTLSKEENADMSDKEITLPSGSFNIDELTAVLNSLPFDITFVDKNDNVRYFSQGKERHFARALSVIGRNVSNCHPPASVHIVEQIVDDFKSGKKDSEEFWIKMGEKYIYIRYFAVRHNGEYLGVAEVTQDIAPIQDISGEKRLMD